MEISGFVTKILTVEDAVIFCFKNHIAAWNLLKNLKSLTIEYGSYRFKINCVFSPDEEYPHMIVVESINRLSNIYAKGMYKKEVDTKNEIKLLKSIVATLEGDYKIIYSGDFPQLEQGITELVKNKTKELREHDS